MEDIWRRMEEEAESGEIRRRRQDLRLSNVLVKCLKIEELAFAGSVMISCRIVVSVTWIRFPATESFVLLLSSFRDRRCDAGERMLFQKDRIGDRGHLGGGG
jgi:hypothetical protein